MPPDEIGQIRSELTQIWDELGKLSQRASGQETALARIEENLRGIRELLSERCEIRGQGQNELFSRVRSLEQRVWWASGAAAAVSFMVGQVMKGLGH